MLSPWLTLILILLSLLILLCGAVVLGMAQLLLKPPRMTDGKATYVLQRLSPADLGLAYERVVFDVRDEAAAAPLRVAGWWIPPAVATGKCVVALHGYGDAKVGAIAWAPTFHALGWGVLAIDLRAHGESGGSHTTAGYFERHDVGDVINQFRAARPGETREVVLFGVSLGAAVAAAVGAGRDDLAGVILESPFADYRSAIAAHAHILGHPGGLLQRMGVRVAESISGADFGAVRPVDTIPRIGAPLMIVLAGDDPFVPPASVARIESAAEARPPDAVTVLWHAEGAAHVQALAIDPDAYRVRLERFLDSLHGAAPNAPAAVTFSSPPSRR